MKNSKKNSLLKRGSALLLVLATIATTLPNSGLWADEVTTDNTEVVSENTIEATSETVENSEGNQPAESKGEMNQENIKGNTDQTEPEPTPEPEPVELKTFYAKVTEGGSIEVTANNSKVTLKKQGDKILRVDQNGSQEDISNQSTENGYYPAMSVEVGTVVYTTVRSDSGFKVETYRQLIDNGEEKDVDGFETLSSQFDYELTIETDYSCRNC